MTDLAQQPPPIPTVVSPDPPAITVRNLTKRYGAHLALHDVSLDVPSGSVCGLIGPNGAGKSTLMSIVATLVTPTAGAGWVYGHPLDHSATIRRLIGYVPDVLGTYTGLTVREYLEFFADAYKVERSDRDGLINGLLELVDLTSKTDSDLNTLSRGMKQRISLARGLIHQPKLLILDEPASGLDPHARVELRDIILHLRSLGTTVLISSHILSELEEMCSHAIVIEQGRLMAFEDLGVSPDRTVDITFADGTSETFTVVDDIAQVALVRQLVSEGRSVLTVAATRNGLSERFHRLTQGQVN